MRTRVAHRQRLAVLVLAFFAGACTSTPSTPADAGVSRPLDLVQRQLTRDGIDTTLLATIDGGGVRASAPRRNTGSNSRALFLSPDAPAALDEGACATVTQSGLPVQEGIALRVTTERGRTRAITVTKNVWAGVSWRYNVHLWDTEDAEPFRQIGSFDLSDALERGGPVERTTSSGASDAFGRRDTRREGAVDARLCARAVGDRVELKVWDTGGAEPEWGDPVATRELVVDTEWVRPGTAGWYIGHLPPGGWAEFRAMTAWTGATAPADQLQ